MAATKQTELQFAKILYVKEGLSQKDIALKVGVTEKTISNWVNKYKWNDLKRSMSATRSHIIIGLQEQLELLQQAIAEREDKLATSKEADTLVKLATSIKKLETELGVGETINVAMELINYIKPLDFDFAIKLNEYADLFIKEKMNING